MKLIDAKKAYQKISWDYPFKLATKLTKIHHARAALQMVTALTNIKVQFL
jgi:hypothetical protein